MPVTSGIPLWSVEIHDQAPVGYQVKPIEDVVEKQVSFSALHLRFLLWLGGYYMATPGEVMKAALPVAFRLESFTSITRTTEDVDYVGLTTNEKILLRFLQPGEYVSLKEAEKYLKIKKRASVGEKSVGPELHPD